MANKTYWTSPKGVASYPHLTKPDTKGEYADNKFKTSLVVDEATAKKLEAEFDKIAKDLGVKGVKRPLRQYKGDWVVTAKSKYRPVLVDASRNEIDVEADPDFFVRGGSTIRISTEVVPYRDGIALRLKKVQVIELASRPSEFDDEGGFAYGGPKASSTRDDDDFGDEESGDNGLDI